MPESTENNNRNKSQLPECLQHRVSLKRLTVAALESIIEATKGGKGTSDAQLLILTPAGIIRGTPADVVTEPKDALKVVSQKQLADGTTNATLSVDVSIAYQLRNNLLEEYESENPPVDIIDNGSLLNLTNATLTPVSNPHTNFNFAQILVFVDQIIGACIVSRQNYESQLANER